MAVRVRADVERLWRAERGHHAPDPAPAGAPRAARALRSARRDARDAAGPQIRHRARARAVRWLRRPRVQPAVAPDELLGGSGADLRGTPLRLAGRAWRLARDRRGPGRGRARARR